MNLEDMDKDKDLTITGDMIETTAVTLTMKEHLTSPTGGIGVL